MAHFRTTSPDGVALPFVFESAQSASSNALVSLSFRNKDDDSKNIYKMASIDVYDSGAISGNSLKDGFGTLAISTASNGDVSEVCRMTDENFVGVNTKTPEATLHVVGTARFDTSSFVSACAIRAPRTVPVGLATVASSSPETVHAWVSEGFSNFSVLAKFSSNAGDDPSSSNFGYNVGRRSPLGLFATSLGRTAFSRPFRRRPRALSSSSARSSAVSGLMSRSRRSISGDENK